MTFTGTLADINNALDGITFGSFQWKVFRPRLQDFYGLTEVSITVDDQGYTGQAGL